MGFYSTTVKSAYGYESPRMEKCAEIMQKIYDERPEHWPNGLHPVLFDDLYLVKSAEENTEVGFVGWQVRQEKQGTVGYYSIGVLPEYRRNGFAKEAICKMVEKLGSGVDIVRALIVKGNTPSEELAKDIGADVKQANVGALAKWLPLAAGIGVPTAWDQAFLYPDRSLFKAEDWDSNRIGTFAINSAMGAGGGAMFNMGNAAKKNPMLFKAGLGAMGVGPAVKPMAGESIGLIRALKENVGKGEIDPKLLGLLAGAGLLTGGAVWGASKLKDAIFGGSENLRRGIDDAAEKQREGRVRITLPTDDPSDHETVVDLPMNKDVNIPMTLRQSIGRDTRRKLREEAKERTWRRVDGRLVTNAEAEKIEA